MTAPLTPVLIATLRSGNSSHLERLLRDHPEISLSEPINMGSDKAPSLECPLHWAVEQGNERLMRVLLENGAPPNGASSSMGLPPLCHLMEERHRFGQPHALDLLLSFGADPHGAAQGTLFRANSLSLAITGNGRQPNGRSARNTSADATASAHRMWGHAEAAGHPFPSVSAWHCWLAVLLHRNRSWEQRLKEAQADPSSADEDYEAEIGWGLVAELALSARGNALAHGLDVLAEMGLAWRCSATNAPKDSRLRETYERLVTEKRAVRLLSVLKPVGQEESQRERF